MKIKLLKMLRSNHRIVELCNGQYILQVKQYFFWKNSIHDGDNLHYSSYFDDLKKAIKYKRKKILNYVRYLRNENEELLEKKGRRIKKVLQL